MRPSRKSAPPTSRALRDSPLECRQLGVIFGKTAVSALFGLFLFAADGDVPFQLLPAGVCPHLGIFGLATFNVNTRTRQIRPRRHVGARKRDIVSYFMAENWMVTTLGVVVGCGLALLVGFWLSNQFGLPRLDLYFLVGGVAGLWALGQLAAWQPALRAAKVSPAMARTLDRLAMTRDRAE